MRYSKRINLFLMCICLFIIIQISSFQSVKINEINNIISNGLDNQLFDRISVIYVNGSFYEMGYQLGAQIAVEINETIRGFHHHFEQLGIPFQAFLDLWETQVPYVPHQVIDYTEGIADGSGLPLEYIATLWVYDGVLYNKCSSFAVWGDASVDGKLYQARSLDGPGSIQDPVSGKFAQENAVLIVGEPDEGYAFCYPTFAGYVVEGGMNAAGVTVCNLWSPNTDGCESGSPMGVRLFEALYSASSADEAIEVLTTNKTFGYNFLACDGSMPMGYVVETTANLTYVGGWNDASEDIAPFWTIKDSIRRSNCYLDPQLVAMQREIYSPRAFRYIFNVLPGGVMWYHSWLRYKSMGKGIEQWYSDIDLNLSMGILRKVYHGGYDLMWFVMNQIYNPMQAWWQWAACPQTGDFQVSFASADNLAYDEPVYSFNLFEILSSPP